MQSKAGVLQRVEAPTRRKDITPVAQEPDFMDQEDEPEVTLPEGYEESDFDDRRPNLQMKSESPAKPAEPEAVKPESSSGRNR